MRRRLLAAGALVAAGCATTHPHPSGGLIHIHASPVLPVSSTSAPEAPPARAPVQTRASRNARRRSPSTTPTTQPAAGTNLAGVHVTSTAYCETTRTASGGHPYNGSAAANRWPLGTRLHVVELGRDVTINDRIGHGSELDIAMPGDCSAAIRYGRRTVTVQVVAA